MARRETISFVGGDDLIEPFVVLATDGSIVDLTGATVTGLVRAPNRPELALAVGSGIEIANSLPTAGGPHGYVRLSRAQTAALPIGRQATMRLSVVFASALRNSTYDFLLERIL